MTSGLIAGSFPFPGEIKTAECNPSWFVVFNVFSLSSLSLSRFSSHIYIEPVSLPFSQLPLPYITMCIDARLLRLRILSPAMPFDHLVSRPPVDFVTEEPSPTADSSKGVLSGITMSRRSRQIHMANASREERPGFHPFHCLILIYLGSLIFVRRQRQSSTVQSKIAYQRPTYYHVPLWCESTRLCSYLTGRVP